MRKTYRIALYSGVASAALVLAAPAAFAQTVVTQSATNSAPVSNPTGPGGTNTIDMGGGGLGVGASVSTSAGGAVVSTSVTGINSQFVNPTGGFGTVTQGALNDQASAAITNGGAIINAGGIADSGSSLSISARGAGASFSIIAVGGIPFQPVANVGDIAQGLVPLVASPPVGNAGTVINAGEITGPSGGPALELSGMGASASVSAGGAQSSVSLSVMGATTFTGTTFGAINQAPNNATTGSVFNNLTTAGISLGAISGDGASASASATGAAASVSLSYINTTNWSPTQIGLIFQNPQNNAASVSNNGDAGITVGAISGDGASVRSTAAGAFAGVSYSTIGSAVAAGGTGQTLGNVGQLVTSTGNVYSDAAFTGTVLSGAGSAVVSSAVGAGASFSASSIGDTSTSPLTMTGGIQGFPVTQQVSNTGANITNFGQITFGAISGNGAAASMSATGAQASIGISAINTTAYTTPLLGAINQTVTNGSVASPNIVMNNSTGVTVGNLSGHGSSVSVGATGAAASVGVSFINTTAWTSFPLGGVIQSATNNGAISNTPNVDTISVGTLSGTGASVRASATGAVASVSVNSILSGPPATSIFGSSGISQTAINTGAIINRASIVSTGTLSGMASSASISATGAATSVAVASIADTVVMPPPTATIQSITQTSTNNLASPITNTGSITLGGGNLGVGAAASISAVGASASISFLAVK